MANDINICVHVIDDDASVRRSMEMLLFSAGMKVQTYESAEAFLASDFREELACVVTDHKMPGLGGLELQQQLKARGIGVPVIILTAFDSEKDRKRAFKSGAAGFFRKPVDDQALLDTIRWALSRESEKNNVP